MSSDVTAGDVIAAAERLAEEEGLAALSVRRLGTELGVSRQVVYTHFGGVHGLLTAVHRRTARHLAGQVESLDETPGSLEHVLATGRVYTREARRRPRLFELAFGRPHPSYEPDDETLAVSREAFEPIIACARAWLGADGRSVDRGEEIELARVLWAVAHGHITLELAGHADPSTTDRLLDRAVTAVVRGWSAGADDGQDDGQREQ